MKLAWMMDLHLDRATESSRTAFLRQLQDETYDAALITGDVSDAHQLQTHLDELAEACAPRTVYFVLGNHDFYQSSFAEVERRVADVCLARHNLKHLGKEGPIPIGQESALIGHRGWADGRAGWGNRSAARNPDRERIADFRGLSNEKMFQKMGELGKESAAYFRRSLPYALKCYRNVWIATHVPPFTDAALYNATPCDRLRQPFYSNVSAGGVIKGIAERYPEKTVTILCGHTHSSADVRIGANVNVRAGRSRPGFPEIQEIVYLN